MFLCQSRKAYFDVCVGKSIFVSMYESLFSPQAMIHKEIKTYKSLHGSISIVLQFGNQRGFISTAKELQILQLHIEIHFVFSLVSNYVLT